MKRKRSPLPPRRKRMTRPARLASAQHWIEKFSGKNVVRAYAKWFGVDLLCAVKELSLCGVAVDPAYLAQLKTTFSRRNSRRSKPPVADPRLAEYGIDWDENFAFIAGRTAGGFPYGTTWEELEAEARGEDPLIPPNPDEDDPF
ncbi:MAG TPA: hypothetical protein VMR20_01205 [Verrucomicrobiae bacterium]|nr:hypothetical protein [Verrucomicrobiae bacterium]